MPVGIVERIGCLACDTKRVFDWQLSLPGEAGPKGLPFNVRHGKPEPARCFTGVEYREDVGVLEPGGELDLSEESLRPQRLGQLGMKHLEGNRPVVSEVV